VLPTAFERRLKMTTETAHKHDLLAEDLVLLLIAAEGPDGGTGRLNGITRLEKLLFLADKETKVSAAVNQPFAFRAYDYGPYSKGVYEAVDLLEQAGLLREERVLEGASLDELEEDFAAGSDVREGVERRFVLTDSGKQVADLLRTRNPRESTDLATIKKQYSDLPLRTLIRLVYRKYPEYAKASKIRSEILNY
jgi:hypothetical protein